MITLRGSVKADIFVLFSGGFQSGGCLTLALSDLAKGKLGTASAFVVFALFGLLLSFIISCVLLSRFKIIAPHDEMVAATPETEVWSG